MKKTQIDGWKRKIELQRAKVAKMRDGLRDCKDELEGLEECCQRAEENLQYAIDALSELA